MDGNYCHDGHDGNDLDVVGWNEKDDSKFKKYLSKYLFSS